MWQGHTNQSRHTETDAAATIARERQHLLTAKTLLESESGGTGHTSIDETDALAGLIKDRDVALPADFRELLETWPAIVETYTTSDDSLTVTSLSGTVMSKVSLPNYHDDGDMLSWLRREHLPGYFPYTCLLYTSPSPRDLSTSRMPSSA